VRTVKTLQQLFSNVEIAETDGNMDVPVRGLAYDSRKVTEGDLFVAVRGAKQDGHRYIAQAIRKGAAAVVAEELPREPLSVTAVLVPDTRRVLSTLSAKFYDHPSRRLCLIGVTGTNGKTTTTLLLESILREAGCKVGVIGTLAYRWGGKELPAPMTTPESPDLQALLHEMVQDGVTHVLMEVSSHALALGRVDSCIFKAGVFTNLSQDHLDFHETMEEYFAAKALLFKEILPAGGEGFVAVVNEDDPFGSRLSQWLESGLWSFGVSSENATVQARQVELSGRGIRALFSMPGMEMEVASPLLGRLNLYNLLCAATTSLALGMKPADVRRGLEKISHVNGRLQRVAVPPDFDGVVVVDYAHTPDALEKALECLREMTRGRLWVVFGCGGDRDRRKRPLMGQVAARAGDLVVLTSDNPRSEVPEQILRDIEAGIKMERMPLLDPGDAFTAARGYVMEGDRRKAIEFALSRARPYDVILIAGKGHETYQLVGDKVLSFDDREVVVSCFNSLKRKVS